MVQFIDNQLKSVPSANDIVPLRDISSNTDKRTTFDGVRTATAPTVSTDANGWTVYDYRTYKRYVKLFGPSYATAGDVGANTTIGPLGEMTNQALPVGVSNRNQLSEYKWTPYVGFNSPIMRVVFEGVPNSGTGTGNFYVRNVSGSTVQVQNINVMIECIRITP